MSPSEYQELVQFLTGQFTQVEGQFTLIDRRFHELTLDMDRRFSIDRDRSVPTIGPGGWLPSIPPPGGRGREMGVNGVSSGVPVAPGGPTPYLIPRLVVQCTTTSSERSGAGLAPAPSP
jgi:hypothetical protein